MLECHNYCSIQSTVEADAEGDMISHFAESTHFVQFILQICSLTVKFGHFFPTVSCGPSVCTTASEHTNIHMAWCSVHSGLETNVCPFTV